MPQEPIAGVRGVVQHGIPPRKLLAEIPMALLTPKMLTSPGAKRYAGLWLVANDLLHIHKSCQMLISVPDLWKGPQGLALMDSALIRYRRCFTGGERAGLKGFEKKLTTSERELHEHVLHLANLHIAHSINDYEVAAAYINVAAEETPVRREQIGVQRLFVTPLDTDQLKRLSSLTGKLAEGVRASHMELLDRMRAEVAAMSDSDLLALETVDIIGGKRNASEQRSWPPKAVDYGFTRVAKQRMVGSKHLASDRGKLTAGRDAPQKHTAQSWGGQYDPN